MRTVTIVRKVVEEVTITDNMYNALVKEPTNEQEHQMWLEVGDGFAEPYGGWSYGNSIEQGVMAVYNSEGEIIAQA